MLSEEGLKGEVLILTSIMGLFCPLSLSRLRKGAMVTELPLVHHKENECNTVIVG
jgi:hypothetical protein